MQKLVGEYVIELKGETIYVRVAQTKELLKAKTYKGHQALDKFKQLCRHLEAKQSQLA
jgi:hypothetical protein